MKRTALKYLTLLSTLYAVVRLLHWPIGFTFFTQLSNVYVALVTFVQLILPENKFLRLVKYTAVVSVFITFLIYLTVLAPMMPGGISEAYRQDHYASLCLHILTPFFSVADLAYGWHLMDREVFLCLWIILFALLGAYLIGWIRFPHDEDEFDEEGNVVVNPRTSVPRFFMALISFAFALYMVPGLWGAPCKAVSAFSPPMNTQDFNLAKSDAVEAKFKDYEAGMQYAAAQHKPVMIDFTGFGCVNCRQMEAAVWTDETVKDLIDNEYVLISLYVDDKTPLPEIIEVKENGQTRKLRTVGDKWSYFQRTKFGAQTQPFYVLLDNEGKPLNRSYSHDESISNYVEFLNMGLKNYRK